MITISLIWINVVISGLILATESETVARVDDGRSPSSSLPLGEEEKAADGYPALPPRNFHLHAIHHTLTFTERPSPFTSGRVFERNACCPPCLVFAAIWM